VLFDLRDIRAAPVADERPEISHELCALIG
jgi:hypothetical protein